jgi:hypothetical protein
MASIRRRSTGVQLVSLPRQLLRSDLEYRLPFRSKNRFHDLTGRKLSRCSVIGLAGFIGDHAAWLCRCTCGKLFVSRSNSLLHRPTGCGCGDGQLQRHGGSKRRGYASWRSMMTLHRNFVCKRWHSFANFHADLGERPKGDFVLSRHDRRKPYSRANAGWVSRREAQQGKGANLYALNGRTLPLKGWAKRIGITYERLRQRLIKCHKYGADVSEAFATPAGESMPCTAGRRGRPKGS